MERVGNGGNASIRGRPRAVGLRCGHSHDKYYGGFQQLGTQEKKWIDDDIEKILEKAVLFGYSSIIYAVDLHTQMLGVSLFRDTIHKDVAPYITYKLCKTFDFRGVIHGVDAEVDEPKSINTFQHYTFYEHF